MLAKTHCQSTSRKKGKRKKRKQRERERERERESSWSGLFPLGVITFGPHSLLLLRAYMLHSPDLFQRNAASFHPHHLLSKTHDDDDLHRLPFAIVVTSGNQLLLQKKSFNSSSKSKRCSSERRGRERERERRERLRRKLALCLERHRQRPQRADSRTVPQSAEQRPQTAQQNSQRV